MDPTPIISQYFFQSPRKDQKKSEKREHIIPNKYNDRRTKYCKP